MSATSDDGYPTRRAELALLERALHQSIPTLGVCLGAQLLALAAGGTVHVGDGSEIGWGPVELLPAAATDALFSGLASGLDVLHWHGDTYTLPPTATPLARSARYPQAFRVGDVAWGLQFHLEVDATAVATFAAAFPDDAALAPGLLDGTPAALTALEPHRDMAIDRFARLALGTTR
jgi:GMP synthase-like glutamine amidotransferase